MRGRRVTDADSILASSGHPVPLDVQIELDAAYMGNKLGWVDLVIWERDVR